MCRRKSLLRAVGAIVAAFGCGILLAFFLPTFFLAVVESLVIVIAGILYILQK